MNVLSRWRRSATALVVAGGVVPLAIAAGAPATASAAPVRTAITTSYNTATYLQDELGFPTADTSPVIQPVTYDNFQWLLQQSGNFAFLIGDPGEDSNFETEAQAVETAAKADGVGTIYWFDPNLSGGTGTATGTTLGSGKTAISEPNLDIRNPSGITSLTAASQTIYGYAWLNLVGQYFGNGVTATATGVGTEEAKVTAVTGTDTVNNYDGYSTEIANGVTNANADAPYDYTATANATPFTTLAGSTDSYFFIYNKANTVTPTSGPNEGTAEPEKIVSWIDLDDETGTTSPPTISTSQIETDVTTAIDGVGAANLADLDQFDWWLSEANAKEVTQASSAADGGNVPLLTSADGNPADGGWKIDQITYPELVDLLKQGANTSNAVILFGGTWCPNTRPVLPFVNQYAQENNVTVFNFDTVLDGGTVGGSSTTSPDNPLQSRNDVGTTSTSPIQANPTFLYGDLITTYLKNIETQYNPNVGDGDVTYYPGGNSADAAATVNKLQVPFLIGYQANASLNPDITSGGGGVTRQWIDEQTDVSGLPYFIEYMSNWWDTNPQPNELGIGGTGRGEVPTDAAIWSTINSELANVTWQTDPTTLYPNTAVYTDDGEYLDSSDYADVALTGSWPDVTAVKSVTSEYDPAEPADYTLISPSALSGALSALGSSAPASLTDAEDDLVTAYNEDTSATTISTLTSDLETVVGAWDIAEQRKTDVIGAWGNANDPGSVIGGLAADHALDVFFGGLPGGVVSTQTVTANPVTYPTAAQISVAISNDYERVPTSDVSLTVKDGSGATVDSASTAVVNDVASFTLPVLSAGTYSYTLSYPGDDQILAFSDTGTLTVSPAVATPAAVKTVTVSRIKVSKVKGLVIKDPTSKAAGKYKVTITTPAGKSLATGKVTIKLKKGSITKTITGELSHGTVTFKVPKLAAGTWKVTISWPGNSSYLAAKATGASIKVAKKVTERATKK